MTERILVAGASGLLGGRVARALLETGVPVRGLTRHPEKLADLARRGLEVARGDLLDPASLAAACDGVAQIFSTANSFMGRGATSPTRVDVPGYRNLVRAAEAADVRRLVHTSATGIEGGRSVDFFRVKMAVDDVIRAGGVPWVLLRPSAFLDVWGGMLLPDALAGRPVKLFGDGSRRTNFIAVDDVAAYALRILARPEIVNESIEVGGPSTISQRDLVDLIARKLGQPVARKKIPALMLRVVSVAVRPFNELAARFAAMGYWSTTQDRPLPGWADAARRFDVTPMSAEEWVARAVAQPGSPG